MVWTKAPTSVGQQGSRVATRSSTCMNHCHSSSRAREGSRQGMLAAMTCTAQALTSAALSPPIHMHCIRWVGMCGTTGSTAGKFDAKEWHRWDGLERDARSCFLLVAVLIESLCKTYH